MKTPKTNHPQWFLVALISLFGLTLQAQAELRVLKPAGGTISAGSTFQVLWQSSSPLDEVELTLIFGDRVIGSPIQLRGRLDRSGYWMAAWRVPSRVASGVYRIRLQNPRAREQAFSRTFNITASRPGGGDRPTAGLTLVGFPRTGETIYATHQRRLSWRTSDPSMRVNIRLMRHSRHVNHLTSNQASSFNWTIGRNYAPDEPAPAPGMGYQLVVESTDGSVREISPAFAIHWPTIQLQEPSASARAGTIRGDRRNTIRWTSRNLEGDVVVSLYQRTNLLRSGEWTELGRGGASGSVTASWMDAYERRRNNWESGTAKIVIRSTRAPGVFMQTEDFTISNTR